MRTSHYLSIFIASRLLAELNLPGASMRASENDWPQFRGPGARGVGLSTNLPEQWSATDNVAWKTTIAGSGWSSPIVWGKQVFVTTAISAGDSEAPKKGLYFGGERKDAPRPEHQWKVLCLDLSSGRVNWEKAVHQGQPAGPKHLKNSYASETPVTDGEHVYVYIGNAGIYCLD